MTRRHGHQNDDANSQSEDCLTETQVSEKWTQDREWILSMMYDFQPTSKGHLGYITAAKHRIELLHDHTKTVHSAPYRAGSKTRELKYPETDKMQRKQAIEPTQTKWTAPILFAPKKTEPSDFASNLGS